MTLDEYKEIADNGKVSVNGVEMNVSLGDSDVGSASSKLGTFLSTVAAMAVRTVSKFVGDGGYCYASETSSYSAEATGLFTVNSLIFGEYALFNPKPYELSTDIVPLDAQDFGSGETGSGILGNIDDIKEKAIVIGKVLMRIALIITVPMIVYALIRVLMASTAPDVAAWKKILIRWVLCFVLLFVFPIILITIDTFAQVVVEALWNIRTSMEEAGYASFETTVIETLSFQLESTGGVTSLAYSIIFVALVIMQAVFLVKYVVRTFATIFLFMLAPMVIALHSLNLMLGKESNILGEFFKNYISLAFMQTVHIVFYLIFFFSLSEMAIRVPILGILLLYAVFRASSIAKAMFGWELSSSIFSLKGK